MSPRSDRKKKNANENHASETDGNLTLPPRLDDNWMEVIDIAMKLQAPLAKSYVNKLRKEHPDWTPDQLMGAASARFLQVMTMTGAGVGGVASLPGLGTAVAVGLSIGEGVSFAEACAFLTLAAAEAHGVDMNDKETRRIIMLGVLGGEQGNKIVAKALGEDGVRWESVLAGTTGGIVPNMVSKQMYRYVQRYMMRRAGRVWLARLIPFGIGAVLGGYGARAISRSVVEALEEIFSHAPVIESSIVDQQIDQ